MIRDVLMGVALTISVLALVLVLWPGEEQDIAPTLINESEVNQESLFERCLTLAHTLPTSPVRYNHVYELVVSEMERLGCDSLVNGD